MLKKETMRVYLGKSISFCKQIQVFTQKKNAKVVKKWAGEKKRMLKWISCLETLLHNLSKEQKEWVSLNQVFATLMISKSSFLRRVLYKKYYRVRMYTN